MSTLYWCTSIASLAGVWLNIHHHRACFDLWTITNTIWAIADWQHDLPEQAALQAVYIVLAVYGLIRWRPDPVTPSEAPS